ncbi:outer membrane protein assembly factor BamE [Methylobacter sp. S3L5C]|uniref:outer membrane protein assembly factor BamE n=1 Tax=Methylobacter sp. S3L5C TaxID=2839024 RepID=UPI001FABCADE|nr:outer membrane protein assembly factor BamE [Methylobacter sp. S3L5C]UOA08967.1 outer membrane protein assembly factor BamE [Methylobacter sp. S3L5C]
MRKSLYYLSLLTSLTLVSCSTILNNLPGVYNLEIQQGNIIDQGMVDQLRPAMNKRQVLYIMGSPMLDNVFHKNRWDYIYSIEPDGEDRIQKQISLFFENDQIVGIQGDFRPGAAPAIRSLGEISINVPKRDLDRTLWEKITGLFGYDDVEDAPKPEAKSSPGPESVKLPL